jgi:cytochrome oxidase Cu insertion factor (SCO1/SenC/PrrC family)
MWTAIAVLAVLGLGGQAVEHYFGNIGLPTSSAPTTTFTAPTTLPLHSTTTGPSIAAQDSAFIDLKLIGTAAATKFSFTDQHGHTYGTSQARGKVTLVTFYNKNCNDICPVLGAELHDLLSDLGPQASKINIVIVNTDPFSFGATSEPLALTIPRLNTDTNVHFVTSTVSNLNVAWKAYGIQVNVGASANQVSHNSLIYFISPDSQISAYATPFAKENKLGQFSLSPSYIARFAQGLKFETISLIA